MFSHVKINVRMILRRHHTHAVKRSDADLDASHSEFVEEQRSLMCSWSTVRPLGRVHHQE
jgi:hypothetical protein